MHTAVCRKRFSPTFSLWGLRYPKATTEAEEKVDQTKFPLLKLFTGPTSRAFGMVQPIEKSLP